MLRYFYRYGLGLQVGSRDRWHDEKVFHYGTMARWKARWKEDKRGLRGERKGRTMEENKEA